MARGLVTPLCGRGIGVRSGFGLRVAALTAKGRRLALGFLVAVAAPPLAAQDAATIETVAGTGSSGFAGDGGLATAAQLFAPRDMALDSSGNLYIADSRNGRIRRVDAATGNISTLYDTGMPAQLNQPHNLFVDGAGNLYIANTERDLVWRRDSMGNLTRLAGDGSGAHGFSGDGGQGSSARVSSPRGLAVDASGNLYIADRENHRIRRVDTAGVITTVVGTGTAGSTGDGGAATAAQLNRPSGVAFDGSGNLYIGEWDGNRVRRVDTAGVITTVVGTGTAGYAGDGGAATSAQINRPYDIDLDSRGNLYIADASNNRIRRVDPAGVITTVAGTGTAGFSGDGGAPTAAQLNAPRGVTLDSSGYVLYIADTVNNRVRKVTFPAPPPPPPPPPPPNEPPMAVGTFADAALEPGERLRVSLAGKFRDPEGERLTYSAETSDAEVANAVVSEGRLWVDGLSPGLATVLVRATDSGGLSAQLAFQVRVGLVLTFAEAEAQAPEGGAARLRVMLNRPSEAAVSTGYVLESDGDPATADADSDDHRGMDGTVALAAGETEAFIEVPFNEDADIEPAREHLQVRLLAPAAGAGWGLGLAAAAAVVQEGVCDRTPAVRDGLRGSRECWAPSVADLAGTGYLNLSRQGIASLRERDFLGLAGLRVLHLHGNRLAELPDGLFAGLDSLERLRLDGNRLAMLQEDLFDGLDLLSSLDLGGNRLSSLPAGLLSNAASLSRLDLGGNRIRALPAGFFEGASSLNEVNLADNPGAPFMLTMELVRTDAALHADGPATLNSRVREGAPFALTAGVTATNADLSRDSVTIRTGDAECSPMQVTLTEGGAAWVRLTEAPAIPDAMCGEVDKGRHPCYQGLTTAAGDELLLFKRLPAVVRVVPGQGVESLGGALELDLAGLFAADRDDALSYRAESSDPALASVRVSGGVLSIEPNDEGLEGLVTVRLTATDSDGLAVQQSFRVEVSPPPRQFGSGWRLGWLQSKFSLEDRPP